MIPPLQNYETLFQEVSKLYRDTKDSLFSAYWKTGKYICQIENSFRDSKENGSASAYGKKVIRQLSADLTERYGKGFSETNIKNMRRFHRLYPKRHPGAQLEWTKFVVLFSVKNEEERRELVRHALEENLTRYQLRKVVQMHRLRKGGESPGTGDGRIPLRGSLYRYSTVERTGFPAEKGEVLVDCGFNTRRSVRIEDMDEHGESRVFKLKKVRGKYVITKSYKRKKKELLFTYKAYVEKVIDGDTLWVNIDCGFHTFVRQKLRLRGVDTPELMFREGKRARSHVREALDECPFVIIRTYKTDIYGRYICDLFYLPGEDDPERVAAEGVFLNDQLIRKGLGRRI